MRSYDRYSPEKRQAYMRQYYQARLAEARSLLGGKCAICESVENLQFDHRNPQEKTFAITSMLMWARARWLAELKKCQLLCHQHHQEKTREDVAQGLVRLGPRS